MVLHELTVFDQGWIPAQLFRDLGMAVEEAIHAGKFTSGYVAVSVVLTTGIFAAIKTLFLVHKSVRVFSDFFADSRMLLEELFEGRMVLDKGPVIHQGRISAQLLGDFGMAVEEAIHVDELASSDVTIANIVVAIEALLLAHERIRVLFELLANFRMLLQIVAKRVTVRHKFMVVD